MTDYADLEKRLREAAHVTGLSKFDEAADAIASLTKQLEETRDVLCLRWPPGFGMPADADLPNLVRQLFDDLGERQVELRDLADAERRRAIQAVPLPAGHDLATFIRYRTQILEALGLSSARRSELLSDQLEQGVSQSAAKPEE